MDSKAALWPHHVGMCAHVLREITDYALYFRAKLLFPLQKGIYKSDVTRPLNSPFQILPRPRLSKQDSAVETEVSLWFGKGWVTTLTKAS